MANLGFIGLGTMGGPMVKRLLEAGHDVTGYNRTKARGDWLLDLGMRWGDTPRDVAADTEVVLSMLRDTEALQAVAGGENGLLAGLGSDKVFVDMSTVSASASKEMAMQVADQGSRMLDAPVSGSAITLEAGQLSIMVGGDPKAFERVEPILRDIGPTVRYVGDNGLALIMKLAINVSLPVQFLAFCEGLLLAEKAGIPPETAMEVLLNSVVASPALKYRAPLILNMPETPLFDVGMMQKDLLLALQLGKELNVPLPTTAVVDQWLTGASAMGLGDLDYAVLYRVLRRMAGMEGS